MQTRVRVCKDIRRATISLRAAMRRRARDALIDALADDSSSGVTISEGEALLSLPSSPEGAPSRSSQAPDEAKDDEGEKEAGRATYHIFFRIDKNSNSGEQSEFLELGWSRTDVTRQKLDVGPVRSLELNRQSF